MSLFDCLETAIGAKAIKEDHARAAQELFSELLEKYSAEMDPATAAALAGRDTKQIMRSGLEAVRRRTAASVLAMRRLDLDIEGHVDFKGRADQADAIKQLLKNTGTAKFTAVESAEKAIARSLFRDLDGFVKKHTKDLLGRTRAKADLAKTRQELEGSTSGDPVSAAFARALSDAFERARQLFNAAGGHIQKFENWAPQAWNRARVTKIPEDEFIDDMIESLDWSRVHDPVTNQPFGSADAPRVRQFLKEARKTLLSDGWNKIEPSLSKVGQALHNRHADHRVLHFRRGEWTRIAEKYGTADLFDASVSHLQSMARDIALMQRFGPDYQAGFEFAVQKVLKQANTGASPIRGNAISRAQGKVNAARNMLAIQSGNANTPVREGFAQFMAGVRDVQTSAFLGSAIASSVTDTATVSFASNFIGMGRSRVLIRAIRNITDGRSIADMQRTVGVLDTVLNTSAAMARFSNDTVGPEITRRMASFVIRAQGLGIWTDILRNSFQQEFMGFLAQNAGRSLDRINPKFAALLKSRGITSAEWDIIRKTPLHRGSTGDFLVPDNLRHRTDIPTKKGEALAIKLQGIIEEQTELAVPSSDLEGKAFFLGATQPGTIHGEFWRSGIMFKNFGISLMLGQIRRVQSIPTAGGKAAYAASFITAMTIMGALAVQLKEAIKGRDPRPMDSATFWAQATVQGGGFGIFGDFFAAGTNRVGGGFAQTLGGPVVGLAQDVFGLTVGNVIQLAKGKDARIGRDFSNFVRHNMPGASLPYLRAPLERIVFDQMQQILDPDAADAFRRQARRQKTVSGNRNFYERGELLPSRAPDFSGVFGG